jgi:hypothetical protein
MDAANAHIETLEAKVRKLVEALQVHAPHIILDPELL